MHRQPPTEGRDRGNEGFFVTVNSDAIIPTQTVGHFPDNKFSLTDDLEFLLNENKWTFRSCDMDNLIKTIQH